MSAHIGDTYEYWRDLVPLGSPSPHVTPTSNSQHDITFPRDSPVTYKAKNIWFHHNGLSHTCYFAVVRFLYVRTFIAKQGFAYYVIIEPFLMQGKTK